MGVTRGEIATTGRRGAAGIPSADWADDPVFVETVLKARARRLARPRDDGAEQLVAGMATLCVSVGGEAYGIALGDLTEVMPLSSWTPVPGLPQYLLGVMNLRGEIRPVLDLHALLSLPAPAVETRCYVVFLRGAGREVGLRVESLERIRFIDGATLTRPHETANGLPQKFVTGITPDTLVLLDSSQILALDVLKDRRAEYRAL